MVAAPKCSDQANDLSAKLESPCDKGRKDELREKGITGKEEVSTGGAAKSARPVSPTPRETPQLLALFGVEGCEARERRECMAVKGRRDWPNAAVAYSSVSLIDRA